MQLAAVTFGASATVMIVGLIGLVVSTQWLTTKDYQYRILMITAPESWFNVWSNRFISMTLVGLFGFALSVAALLV